MIFYGIKRKTEKKVEKILPEPRVEVRGVGWAGAAGEAALFIIYYPPEARKRRGRKKKMRESCVYENFPFPSSHFISLLRR